MEAMTPGFLESLNEKLPKNATINASFANFMFTYYQNEGRVRRDIRISSKQPFDYYFLLNRRSVCSLMAALVERNGAQANTDEHRSMVPASRA